MDGDAVTAVVDDIRQRYGKIDVLLHAGGLLIDRTLPNKEPHQFALVFDVKADGFFSLIKAAKGMPIGATVSFSSVAGRFGNNGQSDYSSANDLLCKICSSMQSWRPDTRGIAIDWTAWGEIGMASRGSVQQILESLGVDMLPPEAGVPTIRRELTYGGTRGEVVVAGRLGAWLEEGPDRRPGRRQGSTRSWRPAPNAADGRRGQIRPAVRRYRSRDDAGSRASSPSSSTTRRTRARPGCPASWPPRRWPSWRSVAAPGYHVAAVENEQMMGAFKFFRMEAAHALPERHRHARRRRAGGARHAALDHRAEAEGLPAQVKEHFIADVRLTAAPLEGRTCEFTPPAVDSLPIDDRRGLQVLLPRAGLPGDRARTVEGNGVRRVFIATTCRPTRRRRRRVARGPTAAWNSASRLPPCGTRRSRTRWPSRSASSRVTAYRQEADADGRLYLRVPDRERRRELRLRRGRRGRQRVRGAGRAIVTVSRPA